MKFVRFSFNWVKNIQWSKLVSGGICLLFGIYGVWSGIKYYQLCELAIETGGQMPEATLAVTCVTTVLGSLIGYLTYNGVLKTSLNKRGLRVSKSGLIESITQNNLCEIISNVEQLTEKEED